MGCTNSKSVETATASTQTMEESTSSKSSSSNNNNTGGSTPQRPKQLPGYTQQPNFGISHEVTSCESWSLATEQLIKLQMGGPPRATTETIGERPAYTTTSSKGSHQEEQQQHPNFVIPKEDWSPATQSMIPHHHFTGESEGEGEAILLGDIVSPPVSSVHGPPRVGHVRHPGEQDADVPQNPLAMTVRQKSSNSQQSSNSSFSFKPDDSVDHDRRSVNSTSALSGVIGIAGGGVENDLADRSFHSFWSGKSINRKSINSTRAEEREDGPLGAGGGGGVEGGSTKSDASVDFEFENGPSPVNNAEFANHSASEDDDKIDTLLFTREELLDIEDARCKSVVGFEDDEPESPLWWQDLIQELLAEVDSRKHFQYCTEELNHHFAPPPPDLVLLVHSWVKNIH